MRRNNSLEIPDQGKGATLSSGTHMQVIQHCDGNCQKTENKTSPGAPLGLAPLVDVAYSKFLTIICPFGPDVYLSYPSGFSPVFLTLQVESTLTLQSIAAALLLQTTNPASWLSYLQQTISISISFPACEVSRTSEILPQPLNPLQSLCSIRAMID